MSNTTNSASACTCGQTKHHEIARRETADGVSVCLWSDGAVTGRMGFALPSVPIARPKTAAAVSRTLAEGWMLLGEVCLYDVDEIGPLYKACRWAAARGRDVGVARERLDNQWRPRVNPTWTVYRTDRDGRPTTRVWRLPRIMWPGLVVWDYCGGQDSAGGRYVLTRVDRTGVCETTGLRFSNLTDLAAHLHEVRS